MKKTIKALAVLLVLGARAGGGFYVSRTGPPGFHPPQTQPPVPVPAETPASIDLQPPVLSGEAETPQAGGAAVAQIVNMERTVKAKRASDLSWEDAKQQMPLYENDAVRTFDKSSATIAFGPDDLLDVDQNALVIIKPRPQGAGESEISLALLSSDFLDGLASKPAPEQARAIQAAASSRQVTIKAIPGTRRPGEKTRVAVHTLPDKSTSVAALSGSLKITNPKGGEIVLKEKMVTKLTDAGILTPRLLPGTPEPVFPDDGATYGFQRKAPRVELKWRPADRARSYRAIVATDSQFKRIFADQKVNGQKAAVAADGSFSFPLALKEGVNLVTIEAIDSAGNSEYGKRLITYKGSKRATASVTGN